MDGWMDCKPLQVQEGYTQFFNFSFTGIVLLTIGSFREIPDIDVINILMEVRKQETGAGGVAVLTGGSADPHTTMLEDSRLSRVLETDQVNCSKPFAKRFA